MGRLVGISGFIGCGKSTVATQLTEEFGFRKDSFATNLKDACAMIFDWPRHLIEGDTKESREWREVTDEWWSAKLGIPNFNARLALQLIGTNSIRNHFNEDIWFLTLENRLRKKNDNVVISDVRFPNELKFIQDQGGILIRVNRGPLPVWYETALLANKGNSIAKDVMTQTYSAAHFSEWAWVGAVDFDYELNNNDSIETLQSSVRDIISKL